MPSVIRILRSTVALQRPVGRQPGELFWNDADKVFGVVDMAGQAVDLVGPGGAGGGIVSTPPAGVSQFIAAAAASDSALTLTGQPGATEPVLRVAVNGAGDLAVVDFQPGADLPSGQSIVTRERGDARYLQLGPSAATALPLDAPGVLTNNGSGGLAWTPGGTSSASIQEVDLDAPGGPTVGAASDAWVTLNGPYTGSVVVGVLASTSYLLTTPADHTLDSGWVELGSQQPYPTPTVEVEDLDAPGGATVGAAAAAWIGVNGPFTADLVIAQFGGTSYILDDAAQPGLDASWTPMLAPPAVQTQYVDLDTPGGVAIGAASDAWIAANSPYAGDVVVAQFGGSAYVLTNPAAAGQDASWSLIGAAANPLDFVQISPATGLNQAITPSDVSDVPLTISLLAGQTGAGLVVRGSAGEGVLEARPDGTLAVGDLLIAGDSGLAWNLDPSGNLLTDGGSAGLGFDPAGGAGGGGALTVSVGDAGTAGAPPAAARMAAFDYAADDDLPSDLSVLTRIRAEAWLTGRWVSNAPAAPADNAVVPTADAPGLTIAAWPGGVEAPFGVVYDSDDVIEAAAGDAALVVGDPVGGTGSGQGRVVLSAAGIVLDGAATDISADLGRDAVTGAAHMTTLAAGSAPRSLRLTIPSGSGLRPEFAEDNPSSPSDSWPAVPLQLVIDEFDPTRRYRSSDLLFSPGADQLYRAEKEVPVGTAWDPTDIVGGGGSDFWLPVGRAAAGASVAYADAPPQQPAVGDLWFRTIAPVDFLIWNGSVWVSTVQPVQGTGGGGGGGTTLPADAKGSLTNDGSGALSWVACLPLSGGHMEQTATLSIGAYSTDPLLQIRANDPIKRGGTFAAQKGGTIGGMVDVRETEAIFGVGDGAALTATGDDVQYTQLGGSTRAALVAGSLLTKGDGDALYAPIGSGGGGGTTLPADAVGWLHNDGAGALSWTTPPGGGGGGAFLPLAGGTMDDDARIAFARGGTGVGGIGPQATADALTIQDSAGTDAVIVSAAGINLRRPSGFNLVLDDNDFKMFNRGQAVAADAASILTKADGDALYAPIGSGGGGGTTLPADAEGSLTNDGAGALSWVPCLPTAGGHVSGTLTMGGLALVPGGGLAGDPRLEIKGNSSTSRGGTFRALDTAGTPGSFFDMRLTSVRLAVADGASLTATADDLQYTQMGGSTRAALVDDSILRKVDGDALYAPIGGGGGGGGTASVTTSDTAPAGPSSGDLWYCTADPVGLFVWYDDGAGSAQWVQTNGSGPSTGGAAPAPSPMAGSDARLKKDVTALEDGALDVINLLRPKRYAFKADGRADVGFVAQDVLPVLPEAVGVMEPGGDGADPLYGMRESSPIIAMLVKALQELHDEVAALKGAA